MLRYLCFFACKNFAKSLEHYHTKYNYFPRLEYYKGVLILTTNRIGTFDEAFKSRIHLSLFCESKAFHDIEK